jgi:DNA invertase Pin-like site-specific DNA recombinase
MTPARRAAIYVRISSDPSGERLGVARQLSACEAKATAMGWTIAGVYEDNDVSASGTKPRPRYEQMLTDLRERKIDAVVVWDLDRLTRRPVEIEAFIDLADRYGVALASVGGDVDLATDNGRMFARIKGAVSRAEVERKSARQKAANDQRADQGKPPGGMRCYGYTPDGMTVIEAEADEIRKAAATMLSGGTIRGVCRDLAERGITTSGGGPWRPTEMRRLLGRPRIAGQRVHRAEIVGPGLWPPILDIDTFRALQGVLTDPARHKAGRPTRHLLSGIARCSVCGGRLFGTKEPRGPVYKCESRAHIVRRAEPIDALVIGVILGRLARPDAADLIARADTREEIAELREEEAALRARLDGLAEAFAEGDIDAGQMRAGSHRLRARLEVVTARMAAQAVTPVVGVLLGAADVGQAWEGLDLDRQRAVIDTLIDVVVSPPGQGARTFDPTTIEITWKGQA